MTLSFAQYEITDAPHMLALGARLAGRLRACDVVLLSGALGAGKTTLSRGLIKALCDVDDVPSPTYTLLQTYEGPEFPVYHFDLYRLENPEDVWELGIEEALDEGVSLIEWPQRLGDLSPDGALHVEIEFMETGRMVKLSGDALWEKRFDNV
ncbi:tRNA (adenosine(37)-N6)-threonylcarbamoyltransferase complex ATPase subunit type 1 TsaE [Robiginitomaculum antarcticum]|uniref:tRNA (adenosine(37)-N6)-threonylcarbamoyltransferase complex ATPase subunit type 1 TsaE n=1 Tax=Robiginitomaculum antarcticum TaxID=437507 RepID=UPI000362960C|nr:tRNA (adenosine(37)-N6)-threonylcarbamoyltransferase complex ATPase subunit type 1 TsaE [Robiginitomaculum antarcticum]